MTAELKEKRSLKVRPPLPDIPLDSEDLLDAMSDNDADGGDPDIGLQGFDFGDTNLPIIARIQRMACCCLGGKEENKVGALL